MSMSYQHQLQLLVDILKNQLDENYGSHDEYEQIQLLARDLLENQSIPPETKSMLTEVKEYASMHDVDGQHGNLSSMEIQQYVDEFQKFTPFG